MQSIHHRAVVDRPAGAAATSPPGDRHEHHPGPRVASGRREGLSRVYDAHGPAVHALATAICGPTAADVVTRDVFVALASVAEACDADDPGLRAYLLTATYGRAIARKRTDPAPLARLPGDEALAVGLTAFGGLSYRQAGRLLRRSEADVCRDIRSGLRRLHGQAGTRLDVDPRPPGAPTTTGGTPAGPAGATQPGQDHAPGEPHGRPTERHGRAPR